MKTKKELREIRGWFPQEPVLKAPLKAQIAPVNISTSFKVRKWLHGFSAFITSLLWRQRSKRFKIEAVLYGVFIFLNFLIYFLVTSNIVSFYLFDFGLVILLFSYLALWWGISYFFKRKQPYKNHPTENMNPYLRLGGTVTCVIAIAVLVYSTYLLDFVYTAPENPSTTPFYLGLVGIFGLILGWGLLYLSRNRSKLVRGELFAILKVKKNTASENTRWSLRLGSAGGLFLVIFSVIQVANSGSGFFWWSGSVVYGEIGIVAGLILLAAGIIGLYGSVIGEKLGGGLMIVAGLFGLISNPIYGAVFGSLLVAGGIAALMEKPKIATPIEKSLFQ